MRIVELLSRSARVACAALFFFALSAGAEQACVGASAVCDASCPQYDACACDPGLPGCEPGYCADGFCGSEDCGCAGNGDCPEDDPACAEAYCGNNTCGPGDCEGCVEDGAQDECGCGDGVCDAGGGEDCANCPGDCQPDPCDKTSWCYNFAECCARSRCSDPGCPGYCDENQPGGVCSVAECCDSGALLCCGSEPAPDDGKNYLCCAGAWADTSTGECCGASAFNEEFWCEKEQGRCIDRNRCAADGAGDTYCEEDAETKCAVAITHECTAGRDWQCQDYCDENPDDDCCADPSSCDGGSCGDEACTRSQDPDYDECLVCPTDCSYSDCLDCSDPCSDPLCPNYPGDEVCLCGNEACDVGECDTCPSDCASGDGMYCGDGVCSGGETGLLCPSDCPAGSPGSSYGCTDSDACNYDGDAEVSDGSCTYPGCTDPSSPNYNPGAGCSGSCTGTGDTCALSGSYEAQVTCGAVSRRYAGLASCDAPTENGECPCDENALAANAAYGAGSLCGATLNTFTVGGSGSYAFRYTVTEVCPAGQVRVDGGCAESCPDGDGDGDGLCDCSAAGVCGACDPCQDIDDPDISSDAARAAAGLREPDAGGRCCAGGECCGEPGYTYQPDENACRLDACGNIDGAQTLGWVSANGLEQDGTSCSCAGGEPVDCPNGPVYCLDPGECCNPVDFYYCPAAGAEGQCIENAACCGPNCECRPGYEKCPNSAGFQCVPEGTCVQGCFSQPQVGSFCTEIIGADGDVSEPWATTYPSTPSLNSFFKAQPVGGSQNFNQARADQEDACGDGDAGTPCYPVYGKIVSLSGEAGCSGTVCSYGQECALSVTCRRADASGYCVEPGQTVAACVDAVCDPCDPESSCYLPDPVEREAVCGCDPAVEVCCSPGELGCVPARGVTIEIVPNVIDEGGNCLILWASQGMRSVTISGDLIGEIDYPDMAYNFAGATLARDVRSSTVFKIVGQGTDGRPYEAADICAVRPSVDEV